VQFVEFEVASSPADFSLSQLESIAGVLAAELRREKYRLTMGRELRTLTNVLEALEQLQVIPRGLTTHQATLDDVFLSLTGKELISA
jgi:hypothetical protein